MKRKQRRIGDRVQLVVEEMLFLFGHSSSSSADIARGRSLQISKLEERILMSASPMVAEVATVAIDASSMGDSIDLIAGNAAVTDAVDVGNVDSQGSVDQGANNSTSNNHTDSATTVGGIELIVIDSRVQDADTLLADLLNADRDFRLLRLDANEDGLGKLASINVTTFADTVDGDTSSVANLLASKGSDGAISLREAILAINAEAGGDTINLSAGTYTLTRVGSGENSASTGDLDILKSVTIIGTGAGTTTISGNGIDRVFETRSGTLNLSGVTIQGGNVAITSKDGGGLMAGSGSFATMTNTVFSGNSARSGGAIFNDGVLTLTNVSIQANSSSQAGGGITDTGISTTLVGVTISNNTTAGTRGGGIYANGGTFSATNVTTGQTQETSGQTRGSSKAVSITPSGNYVVVWTSNQSTGLDANGRGVLMRVFRPDGTPLTGEIQANQTFNSDQQWATVATDDAGKGVIVWTSTAQDNGSSNGVYARRFSAAGALVGNEFLVSTTTTGAQENAAVAMSGSGSFVVTWSGSGTGDADVIFFRRFDASGTPLDATEKLANATNRRVELATSVAMNNAGQFAIAWQVGNSLYMRNFASNGTATTSDIQVNNGLTPTSSAAVGIDAAGRTTVVYRSDGIFSLDTGVWARGFNAHGSERQTWTAIAVGIGTDQTSLSIAMDDAGNFIVAYQSSGDGHGNAVFLQRYDSNLNALGSAFRANTTMTGNQQMASVALLDQNNYVVVWSGQGQGDSDGVFARQYSIAGTAPVITSNGGWPTASVNVTENTIAVTTVTATDLDLPVQTLTYCMLLDGGAHDGGTVYNVHSISLMETPTTVGDVTLSVGTFVIPHSNTSFHNNVYTFTATGTGVEAATQTSDCSLLIDGGRLGLMSGCDKIIGVHLVQRPTYSNGSVLSTGTLLVSIDGGTNTYAAVTETAFDVVALTVTATGASTVATRQLLFDGSDLGLDASSGPNTAAKNLQGLAVVATNLQPVITSNGGGANAAISVAENTTLVTTVTATAVNNNSPVITFNNGGATAAINVAENTTAVTAVTATDADLPSQTLTYSISGGADAAKFTINSTTGVLSFIAASVFETPKDAGANNVYDVVVQASDGTFVDTQAIAVTVTDVGGTLFVDTTLDVLDGNVSSVEQLLANKGFDGKVSLREAIIAINNSTGPQIISLANGFYTLTRTGIKEESGVTGDLDVLGDVVIQGADSGTTIIDGGAIDRTFDLKSSAIVTMQDVTFGNGAIGNKWGGGINLAVGASLNLNRVVVSGNSGDSGGVYSYKATVTAVDTTISGNVGKWGGGFYNDGGTATLQRVTISGNLATNDGAGIYNVTTGATLSLTNVMFFEYTATGDGGGVYTKYAATITNSTIANNIGASGAGIYIASPGSATLKNTIVASNTGGNSNASVISLGNNLDSENSLGLTQPSDLINTNPLLNGLQMNGGYTATHALRIGSLAIDAGSVAGVPVVDQRGFTRDTNPDIGAYEFGPAVSNPPVAANDAYSIDEDMVLTVPVNGVLSSDSDVDGDPVTVALVSGPANGSVVLQPNGSFTYIPGSNFEGNDTFRFLASDGVLSSNVVTAAISVIRAFIGQSNGGSGNNSNGFGFQSSTTTTTSGSSASTTSNTNAGSTSTIVNTDNTNSRSTIFVSSTGSSTTAFVEMDSSVPEIPATPDETTDHKVDDIFGILPTRVSDAVVRIDGADGTASLTDSGRFTGNDFVRRTYSVTERFDFDRVFSQSNTSEEMRQLNAQRESLYRQLSERVVEQSHAVAEQLENSTQFKGRVVGSVGVVTTGFSVGTVLGNPRRNVGVWSAGTGACVDDARSSDGD